MSLIRHLRRVAWYTLITSKLPQVGATCTRCLPDAGRPDKEATSKLRDLYRKKQNPGPIIHGAALPGSIPTVKCLACGCGMYGRHARKEHEDQKETIRVLAAFVNRKLEASAAHL